MIDPLVYTILFLVLIFIGVGYKVYAYYSNVDTTEPLITNLLGFHREEGGDKEYSLI